MVQAAVKRLIIMQEREIQALAQMIVLKKRALKKLWGDFT